MMPGRPAASPTLLLLGFVLLSTLIHGALLSIRKDDRTTSVEALQLAAPLQVIVVSNRGNEPPSPHENVAVEIVDKPLAQGGTQRQQPVQEKIITVNPSVLPASRVKVARQDPPATPPVSSGNRKADSLVADKSKIARRQPAPINHLHAQLHNRLAEHFTYPRLARRMGWEGEVGLGLHIEEDGSLNKIRVVHSSGYTVLDRNAETTLRRIGRITVAANRYIDPVDTQIEVLYRLTD